MPYHDRKTVIPYILIAELGAALLGSSIASAQDRITLETIGAVRMVRADEIRRADAEPRPAEARTATEISAERAPRTE
jgi:hypothetical protein